MIGTFIYFIFRRLNVIECCCRCKAQQKPIMRRYLCYPYSQLLKIVLYGSSGRECTHAHHAFVSNCFQRTGPYTVLFLRQYLECIMVRYSEGARVSEPRAEFVRDKLCLFYSGDQLSYLTRTALLLQGRINRLWIKLNLQFVTNRP